MPKVYVQHSHSLEQEEARARLRALIRGFEEKYRFKADWVEPDRAKVSGQGVKGTLSLVPGKVTFDLDLTFLLSPLKARIESGIASEVARALS